MKQFTTAIDLITLMPREKLVACTMNFLGQLEEHFRHNNIVKSTQCNDMLKDAILYSAQQDQFTTQIQQIAK